MARILYIDDQLSELKLLESILVGGGHTVMLAQDGHDGIEKMRRHGFDLIITDAIMPGGVSGYDVTRTIRSQFGPDKLPIILLTGRREKRDVERAIESGVSDYIIKPVDPVGLLMKIDLALEMKNKRRGHAGEVSVAQTAVIQTTLNVTGITEKGVTLRSSQPLRVGAEIDLGAEFYKKIGMTIAPTLTVTSSEALPADQFRIEAAFAELDPAAVNAVRLWVTFNRSRRIG